ncbi:MAG TPA: VOC family protein [Anaerovoracaceae bacterium]|nr:VOC family protein [Anaerovoracaceae bacterium]
MSDKIIKNLPPAGHIGYVVADVYKAAAEASGLFELKNTDNIFDFIPMRCWAWGREISDCHLKVAMIDWTDNFKIEFIQPCGGDIHYSRFLKATGGGMHHTAHYVDDFEAYRAWLLKKGAEIIFETETEDEIRGYRRSCHVTFQDSRTNIEVLEIARFRNK